MLFRAGDGLLEALAHKGERLASGHRRMALVDRLEICRRLQSCSREVVLAGDLLHAVLLHEREDSRLHRRQARRELEHRSSLFLAFDGLFAVCVHENGERRPIGANRCLDDEGYEATIRWLVEVLELLARELLVLPE